MKPKESKTAARYTPSGTEAEHCSVCRHFIAPKVCRLVVGVISPRGWCKYFAKKAA